MSSYMCENFQLFILYNFQFHHMVLKWVLNFKKTQNQIFGTRSSSGWVLTCVRTFRMTFQTFFNFIIWVYNEFLASKNHKIKFLGRGVLRDEFLHMWELSTFHSLQLSISSYYYGVKTTSRRHKLHFWLFWQERLFFVWFWFSFWLLLYYFF